MLKTIIIILFTTSWLLPNSYQPWTSAYQNSIFIAAALITLFTIKKIKTTAGKTIIYLIIITSIILKTQNSSLKLTTDSIILSYFITLFFLSIISGYNPSIKLKKNDRIIFLILTPIITASFISTLIALKQWLLLSGSIWILDLPENARPFANLGQPNNLSTLLSIGLTSIVYLYEKRLIGSFTSSLSAFFIILGLTLAQSRTFLLATALVIIFFSYKFFLLKEKPRLKPLTLIIWYIFFIALSISLPRLAENLYLYSPELSERLQALERWDLYKQFYNAILKGPLWGYGAGQIASAQVAITPTYPVQMMTFYTHNIILDILIWLGPISGGAIVITSCVWLLRLGWYAKSAESLFSLVAAGFILTHSMLEYPHAYAYFLMPLGLFLGIAQRDIPNQKPFEIPKRAFRYFIGLLTILGSWIVYEYTIIEEDFRLMRFETANIGTIKAKKMAPDVILLTQLSDYTRFARTPIRNNMTEKELDWMHEVAHRNPYPESLSRYIYALAFNNKIKKAQEQLLILKGLHNEKYYITTIENLRYYAKSHPYIDILLKAVDLPDKNKG